MSLFNVMMKSIGNDHAQTRRSYIEEQLADQRRLLMEGEVQMEINLAYGAELFDAMEADKAFDERTSFDESMRLSSMALQARRNAIVRLEELLALEPPDTSDVEE